MCTALPLEMGQQRFGLYHDLPTPGGDTRVVLADAGFEDGEIEQLLADGVVEAG